MNTKAEQIAEMCLDLERTMRLRTTPVGLKRLADKKEIEGVTGWKNFDDVHTGCQYINMARNIGWAFALDTKNLRSCGFAWACGIGEQPSEDSASRAVGTWHKNLEASRKRFHSFPRIPGKIEALLMAPVRLKLFEPEVIWIYGTPAQMILIINAFQHSTYERMEFFCIGESSCVDALHQSYISGKPAVNLPCYGERWFGGTHEEEISMAIPVSQLQRIMEGLHDLAKIGYRYPIPSIAMEANAASEIGMNKMYAPGKREERERTGKSFWD